MRFQVGDYVRITNIDAVPAVGRIGIIVKIFHYPCEDRYAVHVGATIRKALLDEDVVAATEVEYLLDRLTY